MRVRDQAIADAGAAMFINRDDERLGQRYIQRPGTQAPAGAAPKARHEQ